MADLKETDDEELVVVEDKTKLNVVPEHDDDDDDDRPTKTEEAQEETGTDKEREVIRERRRLEKVERKERRETAIKRDKLELDFLSKRNAELERRIAAQEARAQQADVATLSDQVRQAQYQAQQAERVIAKAVEAGNGDDVTQAMRYRDEAMQRAQQLAYRAQQAQMAQRAQQSQPAPIDDLTLVRAREFVESNPWYDPQGRNEESAIVLAIDQALVKDGFNPSSDEYWSELKKRAARRLPEHFGASNQPPEERVARGGPAIGSGREHAPSSTRKEVYISPERKQALVEAGVWDDPVLRQKYVRRYAEYDKVNRA